MSTRPEDLTKDLQRILYCVNNSRHYTGLDYEDFVEQFNGLFYQNKFKTKDQFDENCQLDSIRCCIVVVYIGLCTRKDIIGISKYANVHSIFIYDPGRESTDSISTFQAEKFQGVFQQQNELIDRICRKYYTVPSAASVRDIFVARFKALSKPNENIQISDTDQAEQPDDTHRSLLPREPSSCIFKFMGCTESIVYGKEQEHYISEKHTSILRSMIEYVFKLYESKLGDVNLHNLLLDDQTSSPRINQMQLKTYSSRIKNLTSLIFDEFRTLSIPWAVLNTMNETICSIQLERIRVEIVNIIGFLFWPIFKIDEQLDKLRKYSEESIQSPIFQASNNGPQLIVKLRVRDKTASGRQVSLQIDLYQCKNRSFRGWFEITLLDISGKSPICHHVRNIDGSKVPVTDSIGINDFIEKHHLAGPGQFIREDFTFLIIQVKPVGELNYPLIPQAVKDLLDGFNTPMV